MHSCLLDANNFRLLKIVKHNLILLGRSLGLTVLSLYALAADSMRLLLSALTSFRLFSCRRWTCREKQSQSTVSSLLLASRELILMQDQNEAALCLAWDKWNKYSVLLKEWCLPLAPHPSQIKKPHHPLERKCLQPQSKQSTKRGLFNNSCVANGKIHKASNLL